MTYVLFQQVDPVINLHHENFGGTKIRQLTTCLMNGCQFLLLKNLIGDITDSHNQLS